MEGSIDKTQEVDSGVDLLDPSTVYKPTKSGWTFVGWRKDTVASGDVEISAIMGDEPINLYAPNVAYFSMEIAMDQSLSTYSGGLGFLAGSHMLSAGYLQMPMVGVTMLILWRILPSCNTDILSDGAVRRDDINRRTESFFVAAYFRIFFCP